MPHQLKIVSLSYHFCDSGCLQTSHLRNQHVFDILRGWIAREIDGGVDWQRSRTMHAATTFDILPTQSSTAR
jgi:hypothetical protein